MKKQSMKYLFAIFCALCACQHAPVKQNLAETAGLPSPAVQDSVICPGEMEQIWPDSIPADLFAPKNRKLVCGSYGWYMPDDTITPSGNFVKYLISNDTCCRDYLYLNWGNSHFHQTENLGELRQFHPKMNPRYVGENDQYLFLEGAGSGGLPVIAWLLWVFPLNQNERYGRYETIGPETYDLKSMTILRAVEKNATDYLAIEAYNIRTSHVKPIRLRKRIRKDAPTWDIDSVAITPQSIFLRIEGYDNKGQTVTETVFLPNDIK